MKIVMATAELETEYSQKFLLFIFERYFLFVCLELEWKRQLLKDFTDKSPVPVDSQQDILVSWYPGIWYLAGVTGQCFWQFPMQKQKALTWQQMAWQLHPTAKRMGKVESEK